MRAFTRTQAHHLTHPLSGPSLPIHEMGEAGRPVEPNSGSGVLYSSATEGNVQFIWVEKADNVTILASQW